MALTVGELVAYIRADGTQFDAQIDKSKSKFDGLSNAISSGTKTFATAFAGVATTAGGMATALFLTGSNYNRLQQTSRAALTTIMGGAEAANKQMDKLDEFAKSSPFAKQVFITAQQQLLGFGVQAEKVLPTLDAIQNAVAATGGSGEQILALTDIFAKVTASGKITGQHLNQLGIYGVDAANLIGSQMGKTGEEIRSMITSGALDAGVALDALAAGMQDSFGGATANIKQQFDGAVDRIKGAWRDIGSIIAAPFIDPHGGGLAVEWANKFADALRALEDKVRPAADVIMNRFAPSIAMVSPLLDKARAAINAWDISKLNGQLDSLSKYGTLITPVATALFTLGAGNLPILKQLGIGLNPVVAGIGALVLTSPGLRKAGADFLGALSPLIPVATSLAGVLASSLVTAIEALAPALGDLLAAAANVAVTLGSALAPAAATLIQSLVPIAGVVADVVSWIAQLPGPVLAAVAAFFAFRNMNLGPVVASLGTAFKSMSQTIGFSTAALKGASQQAGVMNTAMSAAKVGVSALGTALKGALLSNPVGIAMTALTTAVMAFSQAAANARARSEAFADALSDTSASATETAAKVEDVVRKMAVTGENADWGWFQKVRTGYDSIADAVEGVGSNLDDFAGAVSGSQSEFDAYIASLDGIKQAMKDSGTYTGAQGAAIEELKTKAGQARTALDDQKRKQEQLTGATKDGTSATKDAATASGDAAAAAKSHADALRETIDAQREAAGAALSQKEAVLRVADQQDRFNEAVRRSIEVQNDAEATDEQRAAAQRNVESALYDSVRGYDALLESMRKNNASGQELNEVAQAQYDQFIANAGAAGVFGEEAEALARELGVTADAVSATEIAAANLSSAVSGVGIAADGTRMSVDELTGSSAAASEAQGILGSQVVTAAAALWDQLEAARAGGAGQSELTGLYYEGRDALAAQMVQMGFTQEQAEAYIDTILTTPHEWDTEFTSNTDDERAKVQELADNILTLPDGTVVIGADVSPAEQRVGEFGARLLSLTSTTNVDANTNPAEMRFNAITGKMEAYTSTTKVDANTAPATGKFNALTGTVESTTSTTHIDAEDSGARAIADASFRYASAMRPSMSLLANDSSARWTIDSALQYGNSKKPTMNVFANTGQAERDINYTARDRTVSLNIRATGGGNLVPSAVMATGGIIKQYAGGGFHQLTPMPPIAQVVPPNTWRVVGDNPRVDEAYIPLERSARSMAILGEAARRMGHAILPLAKGAVTSGRPIGAAGASGPVRVDVSTPPIDYDRLARVLAPVVVEAARDVALAVSAGTARSAANTRTTRGVAW